MKSESWRFDLAHPTWSINPGRLCCSQENQGVERCVAQQARPADRFAHCARLLSAAAISWRSSTRAITPRNTRHYLRRHLSGLERRRSILVIPFFLLSPSCTSSRPLCSPGTTKDLRIGKGYSKDKITSQFHQWFSTQG
jgi:hypothetical protein